ncbi:putative E3 ubiquitin-protein ligase RF298 [Mangifera indica]|uniref:putative E3 ubiquitin-protein ligase RF298 n=1 Tax=Mangifera indica TaxID=29780 RepID=UPI001CFA4608|nr:putative E3 ubiquitin-protein ligase RF298 [Mangifera indica]XP_044503847.1 putative E3 ubiquitin-protein ligase RF298 [Mangifera indica]
MADGRSKVESSFVLSQEIRSKNKRKLFDPSIKNLINLPLSLTEFPWYEQSLKKSQSPLSDPMSSGIRSSLSKEVVRGEECESADWDDPIVCALEELLSAGLLVLFRDAIMQIVEHGYSEEDAEKSVSRHGLYSGGKDLVSNVVDDALAFLEGNGVCASRDEVFENLKQLVDYTVLEMINVLREVKPSFSIAEAMWWLLMCDLNISLACIAEGDLLNFLDGKEISGESSSCSTPSQSRSEALRSLIAPPNTKESNIPNPSNPNAQICPTETLNVGSLPNLPNPRNKGRDPLVMVAQSVEKSLSSLGERVQNMSLTLASEERSGTGRKGRSKRELVTLRHKSLHGHNEKAYKVYGKGTFKSSKLTTIGGCVAEKRVKPLADLPPVQSKSGAPKNCAETGATASSADGSHCVSTSTPLAFPFPDNSSTIPTKCSISALPAPNIEHAASSSSDKHPAARSESCVLLSPMMPDFYAGIPFDESLGKYVPRDEKDELLLKLVPRVQELENELDSWTEWANQKVMQAARRLSKDQAELKALRLEKQEAEQCKREKQMLEENTMKRLSEMEIALNNATGQVERSNTTVHRLELEHVLLKREMEAAKVWAVESATNCMEALEREQKALKDAQSWEGQKALLREELESEKMKSAELQQEISKTRNCQNQVEARLKKERMAKEKLHAQAASIRKEREKLEAAAKAQEEMIKLKAEKQMMKYTVDIKKLEGHVSHLKYKSDSSKIAALRGSADGGYGCFLPGGQGANPAMMGNQIPGFLGGGKICVENVATGGLKQEWECVMCLAEEKSVVFLPCAHQVLCPKCNELHEKECMKDCPSCRTLIQRRISVRFAKPELTCLSRKKGAGL